VIGRSPAAIKWFKTVDKDEDVFVSSKLLEVEVRHQMQNFGGDQDIVDEYLSDFSLLEVDTPLMDEAIAIPGIIGGADSIHLASFDRIRLLDPTLVTHDRQMARAAKALAAKVYDPVTDDPNCPAVA